MWLWTFLTIAFLCSCVLESQAGIIAHSRIERDVDPSSTSENTVVTRVVTSSQQDIESTQSITQTSTTLPSTRASTVTNSSENDPGDGAEESDDGWKIAVGIILPVLIVACAAMAIYICYRKKYPVRMILGREFGKFSNPDYRRPQSNAPTLVREDADDYFTECRNSTMELTSEYNPVSIRFDYDNPGFNKDEEDEEEKERKFIQQKSWLFKKSSSVDDDQTTSSVENQVSTSASEVSRNGMIDSKRQDSSELSDTDLSEVLGEQMVTPKPKPRRKGKPQRNISIESDSSQEKGTTDENVMLKNAPRTLSATSLSSQTGSRESKTETGNKESQYLQTVKMIFEQPSFEQVCEEARARSRSIAVDYPSLQMYRSRIRALSFDTTKSARKQSLLDEALILGRTGHEPRLQISGDADTDKSQDTITSESTATAKSQDLIGPISASVVGIDIREKTTSFVSSSTSEDSGDEDDKITNSVVKDRNEDSRPQEEISIELSAPEGLTLQQLQTLQVHPDISIDLTDGLRERTVSFASINSNPHLITDLDEDTGSESKASEEAMQNTKEEVKTPNTKDEKKPAGSKLSQLFRRFRSHSSSKNTAPKEETKSDAGRSNSVSAIGHQMAVEADDESLDLHVPEMSFTLSDIATDASKAFLDAKTVSDASDHAPSYLLDTDSTGSGEFGHMIAESGLTLKTVENTTDSSYAQRQDNAQRGPPPSEFQAQHLNLPINLPIYSVEDVSLPLSTGGISRESEFENVIDDKDVNAGSDHINLREKRGVSDNEKTYEGNAKSNDDDQDKKTFEGMDDISGKRKLRFSLQDVETRLGSDSDHSDDSASGESEEGMTSYSFGAETHGSFDDSHIANQRRVSQESESHEEMTDKQQFTESTGSGRPISLDIPENIVELVATDQNLAGEQGAGLPKKRLVSDIQFSDDSSNSSLAGGAEIRIISKSSKSRLILDPVTQDPSAANLYDDSDNSDVEISDGEISDILAVTSSEDENTAGLIHTTSAKQGQSTFGVYKFRDDMSDDEDIDV